MEVGGDIKDDNNEDVEYEELNENEELVELPDELADLRGKLYDSERDLQDELDQRGLGDLRIVLWHDKPYLISPSKEHNTFTGEYMFDFAHRGGQKLGYCTATNRIHLVNGRARYPDISYWGYPRCSRDPETGVLEFYGKRDIPIPDVIVQFCWRNTMDYEAQVLNDMMNHSLEYEGGPRSKDHPRVGYLIKMIFSKNTRDVAGMDIYRLPHGTTVDQARDPKDH